jgi:hypothetical protein
MNAAVVQYHEVANEFRTQLKKLGLVCISQKRVDFPSILPSGFQMLTLKYLEKTIFD